MKRWISIALIVFVLLMPLGIWAESVDDFTFLDNMTGEELLGLKYYLQIDKISLLAAEVDRRLNNGGYLQDQTKEVKRNGKKRVDLTPENFRDYFFMDAKVVNVSDTSKRIYSANINTVSGDVVLTCYPLVKCDIYNVNMKVKVLFEESWAQEFSGKSASYFSIQLPADGKITETDHFSTKDNRWSIGLNDNNRWLAIDINCHHNGEWYHGAITEISGYIIVDEEAGV